MSFSINCKTKVNDSDNLGKGVTFAVGALNRDIQKVCLEGDFEENAIILRRNDKLEEEQYRIFHDGNDLVIEASDELGFIYGIFCISRDILGVQNFWFWNDQSFTKKDEYVVPGGFKAFSKKSRIRFRGWFINDEVLIDQWKIEGDDDKPWEMVFEALLRCGGNLVIPGTDKNAEKYRYMASSMGLYITHHHAEPLGAPMFARRYPSLQAAYSQYPELFEDLWEEGIELQKNMKVIWNIGFRGQGDNPFWASDPKFNTPKSRGRLISDVMKVQYDMVKKHDKNAVCCTNIYGEIMELYRDGFIDLPEDVIRIWADNGFGKMVSRRQDNHNPRVECMPVKNSDAKQGIYYHVSFYDLQAANHITMLPNSPQFVKRELKEVIECGGTDYWIVNASNIKPHVYYLDFVSKIWQDGDVDIASQQKDYIDHYYNGEKEALDRLPEYWDAAAVYGDHEDEHAGEQYANHVARGLLTQYLTDKEKTAETLLWAFPEAKTLKQQIDLYLEKVKRGSESYRKYENQCRQSMLRMSEKAGRLFADSILLQAGILRCSYEGAESVCKGLLAAMRGDYKEAFYILGCAKEKYIEADHLLRSREHGKWKDFYKNECLTALKESAQVIAAVMGYLRVVGDGPYYYKWLREFVYSESDRNVPLILRMDNSPSDEELFGYMKARHGDSFD